MSHIVEIRAKMRHADVVRAACRRLSLPHPVKGTTKLYSGIVKGLAVQLPGWSYPVVCDLATGNVKYENGGGRWGDLAQLDRFLHAYVVEKALLEAAQQKVAP